jgi:hypothetical protein
MGGSFGEWDTVESLWIGIVAETKSRSPDSKKLGINVTMPVNRGSIS